MRNSSLTERSRRVEICDSVMGDLAVASSSSTSRPFSSAGARYLAPPLPVSSSGVLSLVFSISVSSIQPVEGAGGPRQNRFARAGIRVVEPAPRPVKPCRITAGEIDHGPVRAPHQPLRAENGQQVVGGGRDFGLI